MGFNPPTFIRRLLRSRTARFSVPTGSPVYLGAPAIPMDAEVVEALALMVAAHPEVQEAHLPQCWIQNVMPKAAQILVIVSEFDATGAIKRLESEVSGILPKESHLDIWWVTADHSMLPAVRNAGCRIFERPPVSN